VLGVLAPSTPGGTVPPGALLGVGRGGQGAIVPDVLTEEERDQGDDMTPGAGRALRTGLGGGSTDRTHPVTLRVSIQACDYLSTLALHVSPLPN
jgi:hypothetical protein